MKKTLLLNAEVREHTGSKTVRKVREQGRIPAIVYGHKEGSAAISLDAHNRRYSALLTYLPDG